MHLVYEEESLGSVEVDVLLERDRLQQLLERQVTLEKCTAEGVDRRGFACLAGIA